MHNALGAALRQKGDLPAARVEMQEAARLLKLKQDQESAATAISTGRQRLREGRPAEALVFFETAVRLLPETEEGWQLLGETLRKLGRPAEARRALARAAELKARS
ncbi:MAG: hypothetical protein RIR52_2242 [Acidobacteriota bacterium]